MTQSAIAHLRWTAITSSHSFSLMASNDLSRIIPAFATRTCTPPKASSAVLTMASPSSAEVIDATALPPAMNHILSRYSLNKRISLTLLDLINHGVRALGTHVVDHDVGTKTCIHFSVCSANTGTRTSDNHRLSVKTNRRGGLLVGRPVLSGFYNLLATTV
jgi:hypothetical protein